MGIVKAVCISEKRGTEKKNVGSAEFVEGFGIRGDAHGGNWHRQPDTVWWSGSSCRTSRSGSSRS